MVQQITQELLRKRAEHNDGELSSLKEVTLHQFDIEKIENLDVYCRELEILFLQNNQILKIENLHKLKCLKYLQLALNNITKLENLEQCESLEKLDLTVNFIEDPLDVECLVGLEKLRELQLVGNPCTDKPGYREYVITTLPQLKILDMKDIEKSERIEAKQVYNEIRERFINNRLERGIPPPIAIKPIQESAAQIQQGLAERTPEVLQEKRNEFQTKTTSHSVEERLQAARDLAVLKAKDEKKPEPKPVPKLVTPDGRILQTNQGKWKYTFSETDKTLSLDIEVSKFMDTSLMDVDVHETYVKVTIKGKILQLVFDISVDPTQVVCERSTLTGHLLITMMKQSYKSSLIQETKVEIEDVVSEMKRANTQVKAVQEKKVDAPNTNKRYQKLFKPSEAVDISNIVSSFKKKANIQGKKEGIINTSTIHVKPVVDANFIDDPDVPPLC